MSCVKNGILAVGIAIFCSLSCAAGERTIDTAITTAITQAASPNELNREVQLPDGRHIAIKCFGSGSPMVILEAGFDWGGSWSWLSVLPGVGRFTRVCAYDRAGSGFSEPGPMPRDAKHIVSDLHALLRAAGEKPPYILVGHSLGGVLVRLYRIRYPSEVEGMVLVDPSQPGPNEWRKPWIPKLHRCLKLAEQGAITADTKDCMPPNMNSPPSVVVAVAQRPDTWRSQISELEHVDAYFSELRIAERPPIVTPLIVLTASEQTGLDAKALANWIAGHKSIAALSSRGKQRLIPGSSHNVPVDRPEVVVQAVEDMIRGAGSPP